MRRFLATLLLGAVCVGGCGRQPVPVPATAPSPARATAEARAERLRAAVADRVPVTGHRQWPGTTSAYRAYFEGSALRYLEETVTEANRGPFQNHYYFDADGLFYYRGEQVAAEGSGAIGPAPRVPVIVEWHGAQVPRAVRIEHYGEDRLPPADVAAIRRRGAELASAAQDEYSARKIP